MIRGSCLCGGVRYEIDGQIGPALNCHCSMCRKATGAASSLGPTPTPVSQQLRLEPVCDLR